MIIEAARLAARQLLSAPFRAVLLKSLGLSLLFLVALWFGAREIFDWVALPWLNAALPELPGWAGWLGVVFTVVAGLGLALALALLVAPVTAGIAALFIDDVADIVERRNYPDDAPGTALPAVRAAITGIKFFGVVVAGNLVAFILMLVPGINIIAFFVVNAYLLGREYFEFAAMRHHSLAEARQVRARHSTTVFLAGLVIAAFVAVPVLNLATPLFASALMVHLHKMVTAADTRAV